MIFDKVGGIILSGLIILIITSIFRPKLLKGVGWVKAFGIGTSLYVVISSLFYAITGKPFLNDSLGFYRFVIALGAIIYVGVILDFYGIKIKKKKITPITTPLQPKSQKPTNKKKVKRKNRL